MNHHDILEDLSGIQTNCGFVVVGSFRKDRFRPYFLFTSFMMTSSNENIIRVIGPLCWKFHNYSPTIEAVCGIEPNAMDGH